MNPPNIKTILGNRIVIRRESVPVDPAALIVAPTDDNREPHFEATVLGVGNPLTEDIQPGDRILCGAHRSQDKVGSRCVTYRGEPAEMISVLDVTALLTIR